MSAVVADARVTRVSTLGTGPVYRVSRMIAGDRWRRSATVGFVRRTGTDWSYRLFDDERWFGLARTRKGAVVDLLARHAREAAS